MITLPFSQGDRHDVGHQGLNGPPRASAPVVRGGALAAERTDAGAAVGSLAPRPYATGLHCHAASTLSAYISDGFLSGYHEIQAFPPQCAQQPFADRLRLGTLRRRFQHSKSQMANALVKLLGENT